MQANKIICIDASCSGFIVSITDRKNGIYEIFSSPSKEFRGENLLHILDEMVEKTGYEKKNTDLLITSKGPGSLTGLRISMSYVKTLAQIFGTKIAAVPTLYLIEKSSGIEEYNTPVLVQARKNMYYVRKTGQKPDFFELIDRQEAMEMADISKKVILEKSCDLKSHMETDKYVLTDVDAKALLELGCANAENEELYGFDELLPEYGGKSVAELLFEKKHKSM